ncbi:MAG: hypothetical protein M3Q44_08190 [bacterium]|nr:hypothetical protein [bacterium]
MIEPDTGIAKRFRPFAQEAQTGFESRVRAIGGQITRLTHPIIGINSLRNRTKNAIDSLPTDKAELEKLIGQKTSHIDPPKNQGRRITQEELYIDATATGIEEGLFQIVKKAITIGMPAEQIAILKQQLQELSEQTFDQGASAIVEKVDCYSQERIARDKERALLRQQVQRGIIETVGATFDLDGQQNIILTQLISNFGHVVSGQVLIDAAKIERIMGLEINDRKGILQYTIEGINKILKSHGKFSIEKGSEGFRIIEKKSPNPLRRL